MSLDQFFTDRALAKRIALWARTICSYEKFGFVDPSKVKIIEPSAGDGALIDGLLAAGFIQAQITAVEIDPSLCDTLRSKFPGVSVVQTDFMSADFRPGGDYYDFALTNPPYSDGRAVRHLTKCSGIAKTTIALALSSIEFGVGKYASLWRGCEITNCAKLVTRPKFCGGSDKGFTAMQDYEVIAFKRRPTQRLPGQIDGCLVEWWNKDDPLPIVD